MEWEEWLEAVCGLVWDPVLSLCSRLLVSGWEKSKIGQQSLCVKAVRYD